MNWLEIILIAVGSATGASFFTAYMVYRHMEKMYDNRLLPDIEELPQAIGDKVEAAVRKAAEDMLPEFEERVKSGFINGVTDVGSLSSNLTNNFIQQGIENLGLFTGRGPSSRRSRRRYQDDST